MWIFFLTRFSLSQAGTIEERPGIPATPAHLTKVIQLMKDEKVRVILTAPWGDRKLADRLAQDTGARIALMASAVDALKGTATYIETVDYNVKTISQALSCRRDLELHMPSIRIAIASLPLAVRRRPVRLGNITIGILQILPADAMRGRRRALSVSSAAALSAPHGILRVDHGRATPSTEHGLRFLPEPVPPTLARTRPPISWRSRRSRG